MTKHMRGRPRHDDLLTPAEWRVVEAVRHGMSARMIALRRGISRDAVKFHISNACAKLGLRDVRALRQWDGIARHSALYGKARMMADEQAGLGPIGQIARTVSDIDGAIRWYRDVLGLTLLFTGGPVAFFDCGGTRLMLSQGVVKPESILYFRVSDIHLAHDGLIARGGVAVAAPHMIHRHADGSEEWMAFYADPDAEALADPHARIIALMSVIKAQE